MCVSVTSRVRTNRFPVHIHHATIAAKREGWGPVAGNARGIDVSNFAGEFNWAGTSGLSFGICRASQGLGAAGTNSPDPFLAWNWPRIKAKGLARGAYHFLDPRLSGAAQASYFVQTVSKVGLETTDMLWLDNETAGSSPAAVAACARDFMARLVSLRPHNPRGVYSFYNFITSGNCAGLGSYPLWLAIFQSATPCSPRRRGTPGSSGSPARPAAMTMTCSTEPRPS